MLCIGVLESNRSSMAPHFAQSLRSYRSIVITPHQTINFGPETGTPCLIFSTERAERLSGLQWDLLLLSRPLSRPLERPIAGRMVVSDSLYNPTSLQISSGIISCGNGNRDTITISSTMGDKRILSIQREIVSLSGRVFEPREIEIPPSPLELSEQLLLTGGLIALGLLPGVD